MERFGRALLKRERLMQLMGQAAKKPVVYVQAGAGYSKTTTIRQYVDAQQGAHVYLALKPMHSVSESFWELLLETSTGEAAEELRRIGVPRQGAGDMAFMSFLKAYVEQRGALYVFLDDFHFVENSRIEEYILIAAAEGIEGLHIFISSRVYQQRLAEKLQAKGLLATIEAAQLAFTEEELRLCLYPEAGQADEARVRYIMEKTEGWPLAVHLLSCTMNDNRSIANSLDDIRPMVYLQMRRELFANYPPEVQRSLVCMALFEIPYEAMLAEVEHIDLAAMRSLAAQHPFITYNERGSYSIHNLYQGFLRTNAEILGEAERRRLYLAGAKWLHSHGRPYEAIEYYRAANDYHTVWAIISESFNSMPTLSMVTYYKEIFAETPMALLEEEPLIHLYAALVLVSCRDSAEAKALLHSLLQKAEQGLLARNVAGEVNLMYGLALFWEQDPAFTLHWARAEQLLEGKSKIIDAQFRLLNIAPLFAPRTMAQKDVDELLCAYEKGFASFMNMTGGCGAGLYEITKAELLYYSTQPEQAAAMVALSEKQAKQNGQHQVLMTLVYYMFHINLYQAKYEKCLENLEYFEGISLHNTQAQHATPAADLILMYLKSLFLSAPQLVVKTHEHMQRETFLTRGRSYTAAMLAMVSKPETYKESLKWLEEIKGRLLEQRLYFTLCYVLNLGSYVCAQLGQQAYGQLLLEEAYAYSNNGQYSFVFVLEAGRTCAAIENYRQKAQPVIPAAWLDEVEKNACRWKHNREKMAAYYHKNWRNPGE